MVQSEGDVAQPPLLTPSLDTQHTPTPTAPRAGVASSLVGDWVAPRCIDSLSSPAGPKITMSPSPEFGRHFHLPRAVVAARAPSWLWAKGRGGGPRQVTRERLSSRLILGAKDPELLVPCKKQGGQLLCALCQPRQGIQGHLMWEKLLSTRH